MERRFIKIYSQGFATKAEIWEDRQTGVQYLFIKDGTAGGLTRLHGAKEGPESKK